MLKRTNRLNLKKDFRYVVSGEKITTPLFKLFYRSGTNEFPLVGISLSKGEFKKAHDRNRARRLVADAVREAYNRLLPNLNLIILPKNVILDHSSQEVKDTLEDVKDIFVAD